MKLVKYLYLQQKNSSKNNYELRITNYELKKMTSTYYITQKQLEILKRIQPVASTYLSNPHTMSSVQTIQFPAFDRADISINIQDNLNTVNFKGIGA